MKRLLYLIINILTLLPTMAQTIVRDAQDGQPVIQASVYDEHGKIIGVTDIDGQLPNVGDSKTIRLTHIAYQPYAKISQGDLLVSSEVRQLKRSMKQRRHEKYAMNLWLFDEYFPVEAEFMTKQEYKAEQKALKNDPQMMSPEAIDRYIDEQHIPELSSDMQLKLEMTRKRQQKKVQASDADDNKYMSQERIYLQTDKPYYAAGDTVWFRVHLLDAATNMPVKQSRFVYVELHDQQADTLMQRLMIRSDEDGVFANAMLLPKDIRSGVYTLVAYTQWMRNFGAESFCYQPLTVAGGQRVRGHRIPLQHISQYDAKVRISGEAATENKPITLDINIQDHDGRPLSGIFAFAVTDYDVVKPDSLFDDIRQSLLRQRLSNHTDTLRHITYPIQTKQLITGRVKGSLGQRIKNPHLLVVNNRTGHRDEFELGDSTRFALAVDNPNGTTFTLEGMRRSGRTTFVELQIDSLTFPKVKLPHYQLTPPASDFSAFVTQSQTQQMYNRANYIELPEVEKVGRKQKPLKQNFLNIEAPRGLPEGDPRIDRAVTMQQLLISLGMRVVYNDGVPTITTPDNAGVLIYVDNIREEDHDYVLNLVPTDVKSIEYFTPNNAINGFFAARPASNSGKVPGVLFVFLKDGSEIVHSKSARPLSMATVQQLGYEQPVEFYSPQYANPSDKTRPDHRTTLYWNPKVKTDTEGHATIRFYASDISKRYLVTLEGVSDDGTIIHHQQVIE